MRNMGDKMAQCDRLRRLVPNLTDADLARVRMPYETVMETEDELRSVGKHRDLRDIWRDEARRMTQNRDYWREIAEAAKAEVERLRRGPLADLACDVASREAERDEARGEVGVRDTTIADLREALVEVKRQRDLAWEAQHVQDREVDRLREERDTAVGRMKQAESDFQRAEERCQRLRLRLAENAEEMKKQRGERDEAERSRCAEWQNREQDKAAGRGAFAEQLGHPLDPNIVETGGEA